jgi:hypothetical protein
MFSDGFRTICRRFPSSLHHGHLSETDNGAEDVVSSFSKLCGILELKVGHANIFNFSPNIRNLSNSISRGSGGSSDSNHTRYMDYGCLDPKEMGIIFPSLGDA